MSHIETVWGKLAGLWMVLGVGSTVVLDNTLTILDTKTVVLGDIVFPMWPTMVEDPASDVNVFSDDPSAQPDKLRFMLTRTTNSDEYEYSVIQRSGGSKTLNWAWYCVRDIPTP